MLPLRDKNDVEPCLQNTTLVAFLKGAGSHFKIPMSTSEGISLRFWVGGKIVFRDGQILLTSTSLQHT